MKKSRKSPSKKPATKRATKSPARKTVAAKVVALTGVPAIGSRWQGGIYAGVARGVNGANDHHLIVADTDKGSVNWKDAKAWAASLQVGGHKDFSLPTRKEQALLFANAADLFQSAWYWSSEQQASDAGFAWVQSFVSGSQYFNPQSLGYRARAVRRVSHLVIRPFANSEEFTWETN